MVYYIFKNMYFTKLEKLKEHAEVKYKLTSYEYTVYCSNTKEFRVVKVN